jgi:hypothetical protein
MKVIFGIVVRVREVSFRLCGQSRILYRLAAQRASPDVPNARGSVPPLDQAAPDRAAPKTSAIAACVSRAATASAS